MKIEPVKDLEKCFFELEYKKKIFNSINAGAKGNKSTSVRDVVRNIFYGALLGAVAIEKVEKKIKKYHQKLDLKPVSDTWMHKKLEEASKEEVHNFSYDVAKYLHLYGMLSVKLSDEKKYTIGHFDGSKKMTHYGCHLTMSGLTEMNVDIEPCINAGQEPQAALRILERAIEHQFKIDICTGDGEFYNFDFMQKVYSMGSNYFIKVRGNDKRGLRIIEDMESAIKVDKVLGTDSIKYTKMFSGNACYRCWTTLEKYPELDHPVMIGKIHTKYIKGPLKGKEETHYFITSATYLTPQDAIIVAIEHWAVETTFNVIQNDFWSEHSYKKSLRQAIILMLIISAAMAMTMFYKIRVLKASEMSKHAQKCLSYKDVREELKDIVMSIAFRALRSLLDEFS